MAALHDIFHEICLTLFILFFFLVPFSPATRSFPVAFGFAFTDHIVKFLTTLQIAAFENTKVVCSRCFFVRAELHT